MSRPRVIVEDGTYHVMSRIAHRQYFLSSEERTRLLGIVKRTADFCGVELIAYAIMSNHFHLLVHVPPAGELNDAELLRRYAAWKGEAAAAELAGRIGPYERKRLKERMNDLSKFMQLAKEWYTFDYNSRNGHVGTLWEARFRSVLVERERLAISNVAGYIDLNPVRAGLVGSAAEYAWSSYGEASGGSILSQSKYAAVYGTERWPETREMHEGVMERLEAARASREAELGARGKLAPGEHWRIRGFTDGMVVGSEEFVERYFQANRSRFPAVRTSGPRRIVGLSVPLKAMRFLR